MKRLRNIASFVRDFADEIVTAWSIARTRACERNGGHSWGDVKHDEILKCPARECSSCGCTMSVPPPIYITHVSPNYSATTTPYKLKIHGSNGGIG